jgi:hypothetical protein
MPQISKSVCLSALPSEYEAGAERFRKALPISGLVADAIAGRLY